MTMILRHPLAISLVLIRFTLSVLALLFTLSSCGCPNSAKGITQISARTPKHRLPQPLPIPKASEAAAYIAMPSAVFTDLKLYYPQAATMSALTEALLQTQGPVDLAKLLAPTIDPNRPWTAIQLVEEDILHLPLRKSQVATANAKLATYPTIGKFGAVTLPEPAQSQFVADKAHGNQPRLAWIDPQTSTITFATSLRGLVTGRELPRAFAKTPIWLEVTQTHVQRYGLKMPFSRVTVQGPRLHDLQVQAALLDKASLPQLNQISQGTLTGLLESANTTLGVSIRPANYQKMITQLVSDINRSVNQAGFLGKMMLNKLAQQSIAVIRSWNGRVFFGLGPNGHVLVGLGTDRPAQAYQQTLRLIRTLMDDLSVGRMLIGDLPRISLAKRGKEPHETYVITLANAQGLLVRQGAALLDKNGRLVIAFAFRERNGGMLAVIGPQAEAMLQTWSRAAASALPAKQSTQDLLAATAMVDAQQLEKLVETGVDDPNLIARILRLKPNKPPLKLILQVQKNLYTARILGPEQKTQPLRKGRTAPASQPGR